MDMRLDEGEDGTRHRRTVYRATLGHGRDLDLGLVRGHVRHRLLHVGWEVRARRSCENQRIAR